MPKIWTLSKLKQYKIEESLVRLLFKAQLEKMNESLQLKNKFYKVKYLGL